MSSGAAVPPEVSDGRKYTCNIEHKVTNFSSLPVNEDHFSPQVSSPEQPDFKWCVEFSIIEVGAEKRLLVFLKPCFPASNTSCSFYYTLSLEDSNGRCKSGHSVASDISPPARVPSRTCHRFKFADVIGAIVDDQLVLKAEVTFALAQAGSIEARCLRLGQAGTGLLADLSGMLGTDHFSDITLQVVGDGQPANFPAHCFLLACRSGHFRERLTGDTPELRERVIRITNADPDTVRHMLANIYTDRFDNNLSTADVLKLLKCAEQYKIPGLKSLSEMHLIRNINNDIAFKCFIAGDKHNAKELKARALGIICSNRNNMGRIREALNDEEDLDQEDRLRLLMEIIYQISMNFLPN